MHKENYKFQFIELFAVVGGLGPPLLRGAVKLPILGNLTGGVRCKARFYSPRQPVRADTPLTSAGGKAFTKHLDKPQFDTLSRGFFGRLRA